jgi:hypothetical protein
LAARERANSLPMPSLAPVMRAQEPRGPNVESCENVRREIFWCYGNGQGHTDFPGRTKRLERTLMKLKMGAQMVKAPASRTMDTRIWEELDSNWTPSRSVIFLIASIVSCGVVVGWGCERAEVRSSR